MAITDGLLGWPGLGQGGSLEWKGVRLNTGDVWFAPKSGWYFITGCGAGGGAAVGNTFGGGAAALICCPIWIPESNGGPVIIGTGNSAANGGDTSLGDILILGGGKLGGAKGTISGNAILNMGYTPTGVSTTGITGLSGSGGPSSAEIDGIYPADVIKQKFSVARGLIAAGTGNNYGGGALSSGGNVAGGNGCLFIAWI